jgi:hypothetical protein
MTYQLVSKQGFNTFRESPLEEQLTFIWQDLTIKDHTGNSPMGAVTQLKKGIYPEGYPPTSFLFAFLDIAGIEESMVAEVGERRIREVTQQTPFVLHRMGYFTDQGVRDIFLMGRDVTRHMTLNEEHRVLLPFDHPAPHKKPTDTIKAQVAECLEQTPLATLVLHKFGSAFNVRLVNGFIHQAQDYLTVANQLRNTKVPEEQQANLEVLVNVEKNLLQDPQNSFRMLRWFKKEQDHSLYFCCVDGKSKGYNNRRAMTGYIRRALAKSPNAAVLVHRAGFPLDFTLSTALKYRDVNQGSIERTLGRAYASYHVHGHTIRDVTSQGIGLFTNTKFSVGQEVNLPVYFPGEQEPSPLEGQVRWVRTDEWVHNFGKDRTSTTKPLEEVFGKPAQGFQYALGIEFNQTYERINEITPPKPKKFTLAR